MKSLSGQPAGPPDDYPTDEDVLSKTPLNNPRPKWPPLGGGPRNDPQQQPSMPGLDWIKANGPGRKSVVTPPYPTAPTDEFFASYADSQLGQNSTFGMDSRDKVDGLSIMKGPYKGRSVRDVMEELRQQYDLSRGIEPLQDPSNPHDPRTKLTGMQKRPTGKMGGGLEYLKKYGPARFANPAKPSIKPLPTKPKPKTTP